VVAYVNVCNVHADKKMQENLARIVFSKICGFLYGFCSAQLLAALQTPSIPASIRDLQVARIGGLLELL
jgi:hypothetical protein